MEVPSRFTDMEFNNRRDYGREENFTNDINASSILSIVAHNTLNPQITIKHVDCEIVDNEVIENDEYSESIIMVGLGDLDFLITSLQAIQFLQREKRNQKWRESNND